MGVPGRTCAGLEGHQAAGGIDVLVGRPDRIDPHATGEVVGRARKPMAARQRGRPAVAVARERSFTRAAAKLGMTQSALSHIIRGLEARLGVRLLTRTTRSVSPTEAGERLLQNVAPRLEEIEAEIAAVSDLGDKPAGTIRITAIDHVVDSVLWPRIAPLLPQYPDLHVEINSDYRMVDIAAERYDIGVRHGDQVEKDMIAVRLTPTCR
jgi:DNA-binding transcriptional LysR family regulator